MTLLLILLLATLFLTTTLLLFTQISSGPFSRWIWGPVCAPVWNPINNAQIDLALHASKLSGNQFIHWLHMPYPVQFRQRSHGGHVNFLTRRVTLGPGQHLATLDALLCIAHESVHVKQGQRWPQYTRIQFLSGIGAFFSTIATGILLALGHHDWALGCAGFAILGVAYHLPWHLYLETEAVQEAPNTLRAFLNDSAQADPPLDAALLLEIESEITRFTTKTLLQYPVQVTTIFLQNLFFGLYAWGLTFFLVRQTLPHF